MESYRHRTHALATPKRFKGGVRPLLAQRYTYVYVYYIHIRRDTKYISEEVLSVFPYGNIASAYFLMPVSYSRVGFLLLFSYRFGVCVCVCRTFGKLSGSLVPVSCERSTGRDEFLIFVSSRGGSKISSTSKRSKNTYSIETSYIHIYISARVFIAAT